MIEEINKLDKMIEQFKQLMNEIEEKHLPLSREVVFSAMVIKKSIDILSIAKNCLSEYVITVQISLLRLLCDNCLAIQSVIELGIIKVMDLINNNERVSSIMIDDEQNMSDGYLKKRVAINYPGFDRLYNFACDGVHFSKQAVCGILDVETNTHINVKIGNMEMKEEIISNNNSMITLSKVIISMLKSIPNMI